MVTLSWLTLRHSLDFSLAGISSKRLFSNPQIWSGHTVTFSHCIILSWISCLYNYFCLFFPLELAFEGYKLHSLFCFMKCLELKCCWVSLTLQTFLTVYGVEEQLSKALRVVQELRLCNSQHWYQVTAIWWHNLNDLAFHFGKQWLE